LQFLYMHRMVYQIHHLSYSPSNLCKTCQ